MSSFAISYGFRHDTSSPRYPQSNGQVERAVRTVKQLLKKATDPYLALLNYRSTPLSWCNYSPAELLMGRRIRTTLPMLSEQLEPDWSFIEDFRLSDRCYKQKMKNNYDQRHRARSLPILEAPSPVFVRTPGGRQTTGIVKQQTPLLVPIMWKHQVVVIAYISLLYHCLHLILRDQSSDSQHPSPVSLPVRSPIKTRLRTGTVIHPPDRLIPINYLDKGRCGGT